MSIADATTAFRAQSEHSSGRAEEAAAPAGPADRTRPPRTIAWRAGQRWSALIGSVSAPDTGQTLAVSLCQPAPLAPITILVGGLALPLQGARTLAGYLAHAITLAQFGEPGQHADVEPADGGRDASAHPGDCGPSGLDAERKRPGWPAPARSSGRSGLGWPLDRPPPIASDVGHGHGPA